MHGKQVFFRLSCDLYLFIFQQVLVFDFGSELYVWAGKRACGDERQVGMKLAREMWKEPFDYNDCDINPIYPLESPMRMTGL